MTKSLSLQHLDAARREATKLGIRGEGTYKLDGGWCRVEITFYPSVKWWVTDLANGIDSRPLLATRRLLDPETARRLEDWL